MPSKKSKRTPPSRNFEDYVLTREQGPKMGLLRVSKKLFQRVLGTSGRPWQTGSSNNSVTKPINIGFPFEFDGITYTKFVVSTKGWMALLDPSVNEFLYTDVFGPPNDSSDIGDHYRIKQTSMWSREHTILAPWFSGALVNLAENLRTTGDGGSPFPSTAVFADLQEKGYFSSALDQLYANRDPVGNSVEYSFQEKSPKGRHLIVRWNSWVNILYNYGTSFGIIKSIVVFESVIYENGRIEFRYCPRKNFDSYSNLISQLGAALIEPSATIGIFKKADARFGWEFRDFSPGLSYRDSERSLYTLGGSIYDASYSDTQSPAVAPEPAFIKPYTINLKLSKNWPGDNSNGARFVFQPPTLRRKVLPRLLIRDMDSRNVMPTVARTGDSRIGNDAIFFDDRRSISYTPGIVSYPTTLPRFYGNTSEGVSDRQDLFSGDFLISASVVKSNVQQYIGNEDKRYISPFEDHKRFENDPGSNEDVFFSEGTPVSEVGMGFTQSLKSKTQLRMTFSVDEKTTLFGTSSSIYYYNSKNRKWQYPISAVNLDFYGKNEVPSAGMDVPKNSNLGEHRIVETDRGFNAYGIPICSGTAPSVNRLSPSVERNGTDPIFNSLWTTENEAAALNKTYGNSFQTHVRYSPTDDETFSLPIAQPFLIEKAVIELPMEAGPSWFLDKTQCFLPEDNARTYDIPYGTYTTNSLGQDIGNIAPTIYSYRSNGFHIGGPALTIALFNNVKTGISTSRRELIMSGTITHYHDDETEIKLYNYEENPNVTWQVVPRGFNAYGTPTTVVYPTEVKEVCTKVGPVAYCIQGDFFTGSVMLKCRAESSNGIIIRDTIFADYAENGAHTAVYGLPAVVDYVFGAGAWKTKPPLGPLSSSPLSNLSFFVENPDADNVRVFGFREKTIVGVNNLCRGATGFDQSARSIFGKEFTTNTLLSYKNPFKEYDTNDVQGYLKTGIEGLYPKILFTQVITKQKTSVSPYLVFPGDKLSLTVSKSRPFCYENSVPSGSFMFDPLSHDIKLNTGSINITLYGSLVSNGTEFHDTLNQPLASEAVHELFAGGTKTW